MTIYLSNRDGNGKTNEEGHYKFQTAVFSGNALGANALKVRENSPLGRNVIVGAGQYKIDTSLGYSYTGWNTADEVVAIGTADPANPRITSIVAYVDKAAATSPTPPNNPGVAKLLAVNGTPSAVPTAPNSTTIQSAVGAGNPYTILAEVRVNAAATTIANVNITDVRSQVLVGSSLVGTSSIATGSVTTAKLADGAVTASKLGGQIVWEELGRVTLSSAANTLTVSSLPLRKYIHLTANVVPGASMDPYLRFNGDTGNNYNWRHDSNNGGTSNVVSTSSIVFTSTGQPYFRFMEADLINVATRPKLLHGFCVETGTAGSANLVQKAEFDGKWENTTTAINSITMFDATGNPNSFAAGTELIVSGHN